MMLTFVPEAAPTCFLLLEDELVLADEAQPVTANAVATAITARVRVLDTEFSFMGG
jgi:hypothetical protein